MLAQSSLQFLHDLKANNNRLWFEENKERYDAFKADYENLAGDLLTELRKFDAGLENVEVKECVFRIYRDVRFSKDKSPYKTRLGIVLRPGGKRSSMAAYYLNIGVGESYVGGGIWRPEATVLNKIRKEIDYFYDELEGIMSAPGFKNSFGTLDVELGQKLSRPPKGYEADNPAIDLLKHKNFIISHPISDEIMTSEKLIPEVMKHFKNMKTFLGFINRGILSDEYGGL